MEDNPDDVFVFKHALDKAALDCRLQVVGGGKQAIEYLSGDGRYADRSVYPLPRLILLDLKLPEIPGIEVLQWIRKNSALQNMTVIILTSSDHPADVKEAYSSGANSILIKPSKADELPDLLRSIGDYWLKRNFSDPS